MEFKAVQIPISSQNVYLPVPVDNRRQLCYVNSIFISCVGVCFSVFNSQETFHEVKVPVCRSFGKPHCCKGKYTSPVHGLAPSISKQWIQLPFPSRQDNPEKQNLQKRICRELRPFQKVSLALILHMLVLTPGLEGNDTRT